MIGNRRRLSILSVFVAALVILSVGIEAYNNGHQLNDNIEWNCGGSCHDDLIVEQSASIVSLAASTLTPNPGGTVFLNVTVVGAEAAATPLGIMIIRSLTLTNSQPSFDGWVIIDNPAGTGAFNYYEEDPVTGGGTWMWTLQAPMAGGSYDLYAREMHGNGERYWNDSLPITFTIVGVDNAPSLYITAPGSAPGEQYLQGTMLAIDWAASDDNPWPSAGNVVNLTYGATPTGGTPIANLQDVGLGTFSWDTSLVPPGVYYINGSVYDSTSQIMEDSTNNSFEILPPDNPPTFYIAAPGFIPGEQYVQGAMLSITWTAADDNPWPAAGLVVNLTYGGMPTGGTPIANDLDVAMGTYNFWDTSVVAPGIYYINGSVWDSSGQMRFNNCNNSFEITAAIDNPPIFSITSPGLTPGEQYVQGTVVPISWSASDDNPWPATGLIVNITYGPTPTGGSPIANNQDVATIFSWDTSGVAPGVYYINGSVYDSSGQKVNASSNNSFEIVIIDLSPTHYVTNPGSTPGEIYGQGSVITITWSAFDESAWPMAGMIVNLSYGPTPAGGTPIANDQDVTVGYGWDTTPVAIGFYFVNASVYDSSGNVSFASCNNSFEITAPDVTPPMILNALAVPSPQELGLPTNVSATITDDTTVDAATVFINVTYPSTATANISMARSVDLFWVDQPFMEIGLYNFMIWVADTSSNWASAGGAFEVVDTTPPAILGTTASPSPQISGGLVNISAQITDLDSVATADVEVFDPLGAPLFNASMLFDPGTGRYYWETTYIPFGTYTFDIWASDPSGNWGTDSGSFVIVGDIVPPVINNVNAIPPVQVSGGNVNVSANVTDETALFGVWVELFDPGMVSIVNTTMSYDAMSALYYYDSSYIAIGQWTFVISANDTSNNWASAQGNFDITDGTPPSIVNALAQPPSQEMGLMVNISAEVTDNVAVFDVSVEVLDPNMVSLGNFTMSFDAISGRYYYENSYVNLGTHTFTVWAQDTSANFNSAAGSFDIVDTTPPMITHTPVTSANLGVAILISADVTDAGTIASVTLYYMNVGDVVYTNVAMVLGVGTEYSASIPPQALTGDVKYYIDAVDASTNMAREPLVGDYMILIIDSVPPTITNPAADPPTVEAGDDTTISADVTDDSGISEVRVFIDGPDDSGGSYVATFNMVTGLYDLTVTPTVPGSYTYAIWALDGSGNWGSETGAFNVTTSAGKTPNPPEGIQTLSVNGNSILVSWVEPDEYEDSSSLDPDDIKGYFVYRSETPTGTYQIVTSQVLRGELYLDGDVQVGDTYYYKIATVMKDNSASELSEFAFGELEEVEVQADVDLMPWMIVVVFAVLFVLTLIAFLLRKKPEEPVSQPPVQQVQQPQVDQQPPVQVEPEQPEQEIEEISGIEEAEDEQLGEIDG